MTISATSAQMQVLVEQMSASQAKALGAMVALSKESTSGQNSVTKTLTNQLSDAVALIASKDPIAHSQIRMTQAGAAATVDAPSDEPYPAVDDTTEARLLAEQDSQRERELADFLARAGIPEES